MKIEKNNTCPNCKKANIEKDISFSGVIFKRIKKYLFFCPLCDWQNMKMIKISETDYQNEVNKKAGIM